MFRSLNISGLAHFSNAVVAFSTSARKDAIVCICLYVRKPICARRWQVAGGRWQVRSQVRAVRMPVDKVG